MNIQLIQDISNFLLDTLINKHGCGWFDGGCYTFVSAVCEVIQEAESYYISRNCNVRDHAVVYLPSIDRYLDADGIQTRSELFNKMKEVELTKVTVLLPFHDLEQYPVYEKIKDTFVKEYYKAA